MKYGQRGKEIKANGMRSKKIKETESVRQISKDKAGRVVFGVGTWGAYLWVGALGCTGVELEAFPV